jgi:hypothetical protein
MTPSGGESRLEVKAAGRRETVRRNNGLVFRKKARNSPFVHYWIHRSRDCPDKVFQELLNHVGTLQVSFLRHWYFRLRDITYEETVPRVAAEQVAGANRR